MRRLLMLAALAIGCGGEPPGAKFGTEAEELSYLSALSNPTPDQWKRRQTLQAEADGVAAREKAVKDRLKHEAKLSLDRMVAESQRKADESEAARAAEESARDIARILEQARKYEAEGEFGLAYRSFKELVEKHPDAPEAKTAREKASIDHEKAYGKKIELP